MGIIVMLNRSAVGETAKFKIARFGALNKWRCIMAKIVARILGLRSIRNKQMRRVPCCAGPYDCTAPVRREK